MNNDNSGNLIIGITGASGAVYAKRMIEKCRILLQKKQLQQVYLVFTATAREIWKYETEDFNLSALPENFTIYNADNFYAPFASGSSQFRGMVVCPCSMGMLGKIAAGIANDLISRTADVCLKEHRKLILTIRETPYNLIHIKNMETVTLAGGIVCPATPSFYSKPQTVLQLIDTVIDRIFDLLQFDIETKRWMTHNC